MQCKYFLNEPSKIALSEDKAIFLILAELDSEGYIEKQTWINLVDKTARKDGKSCSPEEVEVLIEGSKNIPLFDTSHGFRHRHYITRDFKDAPKDKAERCMQNFRAPFDEIFFEVIIDLTLKRKAEAENKDKSGFIASYNSGVDQNLVSCYGWAEDEEIMEMQYKYFQDENSEITSEDKATGLYGVILDDEDRIVKDSYIDLVEKRGHQGGHKFKSVEIEGIIQKLKGLPLLDTGNGIKQKFFINTNRDIVAEDKAYIGVLRHRNSKGKLILEEWFDMTPERKIIRQAFFKVGEDSEIPSSEKILWF